jgi:alcohol dehydrogenase (cytochrome c)
MWPLDQHLARTGSFLPYLVVVLMTTGSIASQIIEVKGFRRWRCSFAASRPTNRCLALLRSFRKQQTVEQIGLRRGVRWRFARARAYGSLNSAQWALYRVPVTQVEGVAATFSPGVDVHFCPGAVGGAEWNSPAYDSQTNLRRKVLLRLLPRRTSLFILVGEVDWCDTVMPKDLNELRSVALGQPWAGMATWNPFWMFGREGRTEGHWAGWVYAADADTGVWKWRLKSNYPIVGAVTPTAGGVVFFGDLGGNFYALDAANGQKLWGQQLGGAIAGGVITYTANGAQKVAVASGFTMLAWPTKIMTAKIEVLGLDSASANQ